MLSACLMAVGTGTALAWTSPVLPQLYEETSWLVITKEQGSWVGSLLALGAIAGAIPSGPMADRLGRKKTLLLLAIPFLLSWAIIILGSKLWLIYLARFIIGAAVGAACVVVPTYISEIAETSTRGSLGAMFQLNITVGILLAFILGAVMNYTAFAIVCGLIEVGFLATFVWMPESPIWLVVSQTYAKSFPFLRFFIVAVYLSLLFRIILKNSFTTINNNAVKGKMIVITES